MTLLLYLTMLFIHLCMSITAYLVMLNFTSCFTTWALRRTWWDMLCNASGLAWAITVTSPRVPFFLVIYAILNSKRPSTDPTDPLHKIPQVASLYCENWAFSPAIYFPLLKQLLHPRTVCLVHYYAKVQGCAGDQSPYTQYHPLLLCLRVKSRPTALVISRWHQMHPGSSNSSVQRIFPFD